MSDWATEERDHAILSLDREKIIAFCILFDIKYPEDYHQFWAGVHKSRLVIKGATPEQVQESLFWLYEHGFAAFIPDQVDV